MLQVPKEIEDKGFIIRWNTIPNPKDAFANDIIYHQSCWIYKQRKISKDGRAFDENHNDTAKVKSDIEIIDIVKSELIHPTASTLDMNNVNNTYIELLKDNDLTDIKNNYKPYLKQLIKDNISFAELIKPNRKKCPEKICTKSQKDCIVDAVLKCKTDINDQVSETAMLIRKEVNANKWWKFEGTFDDHQEPDIMLHSLLNWIIRGPERCLASQNRKLQLDTTVNNITQIIC